MTIRYAPSWMNSAQTTLHTDSRTGEILNASILINANLISVQASDRIGATMSVDPRVRTAVFSQEVQGELIRAAIAQAVGTGLGLAPNWGAAGAYPVDSLHSVSFTQRYGLASSITGMLTLNDVATAEEVAQGVRLVNVNPGPYDELVIKYLYQPTFASSLKSEKETLDGWIRSHAGDPFYTYIRNQPRFDSDPRNNRSALGDDYMKSFDSMLPGIRKGFANYFTWFAEGDRDFLMRKRAYSALYERLSGRIYSILSYIGGIYLNDIREKDVLPSYSMVGRDRQKAALQKALDFAKDIDWVDDARHGVEFGPVDKKADRLRLDIFNGIFGRLPYVEVCTERFPDEAYTASEYLDDIYGVVWEGVLCRRPLQDFEKALQTAFLESIITTSTATAPIGSFSASKSAFAATGRPEINLSSLRNEDNRDRGMNQLQSADDIAGFSSIPPIYTNKTRNSAYYFNLLTRTKDMLDKAILTAPEADRSHYDLLIYRIEKATEIADR